MTPVWLVAGSLSLGLPKAVLRVLVPLKCTWMPLPLHSLLNFSAVLLMYGTTMVVFVVVVVGRGCCCCWWCWLVLLVVGDGWTCVPTGLVPRKGTGSDGGLFWYVKVPCPSCVGWKTLFWPCVLGCCSHFVWAVMWWLLSQLRYWSVCVGFPVDWSAECVVWLYGDQGVQEG